MPKDFNPDDYIEGEDSEAEEADIRRTRKFFIIYIKEIKKKKERDLHTIYVERQKLESMGVL